MGNLFSNILKNDVSSSEQPIETTKTKSSLIESMFNATSDFTHNKNDVSIETEEKEEVVTVSNDTKENTPKQLQYDGEYEIEDGPNVIDLENVTVKFGDFTLFNNLNFHIPNFKGEGQFIAIMGASGSGKSQLARLISGLNKPTKGIVKMYGKPYDDNTYVPMVFQQYSSFPWMTVLDNVALSLKMKGIGKEARDKKALETLKMVGLEGQGDKWAQYPSLSGGQLQRVSLARNLVADSQIIILDEYSSGLDTASKAAMQDILLKLFYDDKIDRTFIMITHDINEALYLSQRVYLLDSKTHTFKDVIDVKFDGKRTRDIIGTPKYQEYYKKIESFFENK